MKRWKSSPSLGLAWTSENWKGSSPTVSSASIYLNNLFIPWVSLTESSNGPTHWGWSRLITENFKSKKYYNLLMTRPPDNRRNPNEQSWQDSGLHTFGSSPSPPFPQFPTHLPSPKKQHLPQWPERIWLQYFRQSSTTLPKIALPSPYSRIVNRGTAMLSMHNHLFWNLEAYQYLTGIFSWFSRRSLASWQRLLESYWTLMKLPASLNFWKTSVA